MQHKGESALNQTCPICRQSIPVGWSECPNCGATLSGSADNLFPCPRCGAGLPIDARFCNSCGAPLGQPSALPPLSDPDIPSFPSNSSTSEKFSAPIIWLLGAIAALGLFLCLGLIFLLRQKDLPTATFFPTAQPEAATLTPRRDNPADSPTLPGPTLQPPTSQPATPTAAPTAHLFAGQRMAYASAGDQNAGRSIFLRCLDDACALRQLTSGTDKYGDNYPTFSPDGQRLAFTRCYLNRSDGCDLFVTDLNGAAPRLVLSGHKVMRPKWCAAASSPYGDWVAFEDRRKNGNDYQDSDSSLGMVNTITGEFRSLTTNLSDWMPAWSADCATIFFTRYDPSDLSGLLAGLMTLNVASGKIDSLTDFGAFSAPAQLSAVASPDGLWLAYRNVTDTSGDGRYRGADDRADAALFPLGGGNSAVWANSFSVASLSWSPNSRWLLVSSTTNQSRILDLQGNTLVILGEEMWHPVFAP